MADGFMLHPRNAAPVDEGAGFGKDEQPARDDWLGRMHITDLALGTN
jgi:hypothetical protein